MIFPALHRFAKNRGLLDDLDFVEQTIHCVLRLRPDGSLAGIVRATDKEQSKRFLVSKIPPRNSAAIACLGADTLNRVIPAFDPEANDLHDHLDTVAAPLNTLDETALCPGSAALDKINASLR